MRTNSQVNFFRKCVGGIKFLTSNSDSTLNFASNDMYEYRVHYRLGLILTEYSVLRPRNQYFRAKFCTANRREDQNGSHISTYRSTRNFAPDPNMTSKFYSIHEFSRKFVLKTLRGRISKFSYSTESFQFIIYFFIYYKYEYNERIFSLFFLLK